MTDSAPSRCLPRISHVLAHTSVESHEANQKQLTSSHKTRNIGGFK